MNEPLEESGDPIDIGIGEVNDARHYANLRKHILRSAQKYSSVDYTLDVLRDDDVDRSIEARNGRVLHGVLELYIPELLEADNYKEWSEATLATAFSLYEERVGSESILVASIVGGENVAPDGSKYEMLPCLHMLFLLDEEKNIEALCSRLAEADKLMNSILYEDLGRHLKSIDGWERTCIDTLTRYYEGDGRIDAYLAEVHEDTCEFVIMKDIDPSTDDNYYEAVFTGKAQSIESAKRNVASWIADDRIALAQQGYGLEQLKDDPDKDVQYAVWVECQSRGIDYDTLGDLEKNQEQGPHAQAEKVKQPKPTKPAKPTKSR